MNHRYRTMGEQLGKKISNPGAHMPHVAVGIIRKKRKIKSDKTENIKGGSSVRPIDEYNPFPMEFLPGSM